MKIGKLFIGICLTGVLLIGGCKESGLTPEQIEKHDFVIASIDSDTKIMASDLYDRLVKSNLLPEGGYLDSTTYIDTLREIVVDSIVSIEAENFNLAEDITLYRRYKKDYQDAYIRYLFDRIILDSINVDSAVVDSFYQANTDVFTIPEKFRARHIIISAEGLRRGEDSLEYKDFDDEQLDSIARHKIEECRTLIENGADFAETAREHSMHLASALKGGDLGYVKKNTFYKEFEDVVLALDSGEIAGPFKTPDGWHLAQLTEHSEAGVKDLAEVYEQSRNTLETNIARELSKQILDSLIKIAKYEFNDSSLQQNASAVPDTTWAMIVNDRDTVDFFRLSEYFHDYKRALNIDSMTIDYKEDALKRKANQILIMQMGDDLGYNEHPEIVEQRRKFHHHFSSVHIGRKSMDYDYNPDDSLVEDYYQKHINDYIVKKPVSVQHIIVEDSIFGEFLRDQALSGIDFMDLAREHYPGAEEIRTAAADLGYIGPGEMPEEFYMMAMRTPVNGVSHPVKTEWGYHIIHVVDRQLNRTLNEVRQDIVKILKRKHAQEVRNRWLNEIINRHDVVYYLKPWKKLQLPPKDERA